jgi:hypothetical protein
MVLDDTDNGPFAMFFKETYAGSFLDEPVDDIYQVNDVSFGEGTDYIWKSIHNHDFDELKRTLFHAFLVSAYQHYSFKLSEVTLPEDEKFDVSSDDKGFYDLSESFDVVATVKETRDEDGGSESDEESENQSYVKRKDSLTLPEMRVLYYILGAALRKTLDTIDNEEHRVALEELICMKESDAMAAELPCEMIIRRQRFRLLFPNKEFFEAFCALEEETVKPMCVNMRKLALLGKSFKQYFESQLNSSLAYEIICSLFNKAIKELNIQECCSLLSYRLIRYYVGTTFNDFVANQFRNMKHDVEMDRNLSKRLKILTNVKIVTSVTEKDQTHISVDSAALGGGGEDTDIITVTAQDF